MSKKMQITLSDEMYEWLENESISFSLRPATTVNVLFNELRKIREEQKKINVLLETFKKLDSEDIKKLIGSEPKEKDLYD